MPLSQAGIIIGSEVWGKMYYGRRLQKKACRHAMIGKECKFLYPVPCRKYMENPERSCRAQCKGYHSELCKYSRATRECYNDRCFRIHLKCTRRKQTPPTTQEPIQLHELQINNKLWSKHEIWLTTAPHPAYHRHSTYPLTNSLPHPTRYAISHHPSDYCSTEP